MERRNGNIDWLTLVFFVLLSLYGIFLLLTTDTALFYQQSLMLGVGLVLFFLCSRIDTVILKWFAPFGYIIANFLLAITYLGPSIRGSTRWILIAGQQIQPSEFAKPLLLLFFAWLAVKYPPREKKNIPIHIGLFLIPFLLVFKQPDLGTSLVYAGSWLGMMIASGLSLWLIGVIVLGLTVLTPWLWGILADYQRARIITFLNPALDPKGAGYNALQSTIAVGSGQLFGKGLGLGTQSHLRFLPEYHTDFIFATLVEELGFVGGSLLLLLYLLLLWRLVLFAWQRSDDVFGFTFILGVVSMVFVQVFINVGMNMGILPITGITLPFVSYGGSSLLSLSICFGLLMTFKRKDNRTQSVAIT
jgi:rod shape determining protein RodA